MFSVNKKQKAARLLSVFCYTASLEAISANLADMSVPGTIAAGQPELFEMCIAGSSDTIPTSGICIVLVI